MAEIRVEQEKRGLGWLWALLALLVLALAAWWFLTQRAGPSTAPADTAAPVDTLSPGDTLAPRDTGASRDSIGARLRPPGTEPGFAYDATLQGGPHGST